MKTVKIKIDDKDVEVQEGLNLIEAARKVNVKIPHYCYHRGLKPDGNCRMCLVEMEGGRKPIPACMTGAADGMQIKTQTEEVQNIRRNVMEFMLLNHPLDCPTCDQAGECKLQDYYMEYDRIPSRNQEPKVHKNKMVDLGGGVMLDEERCVVCTRCVRFCQEVANDEELFVQQRGNKSMVATFPGKPMKNPYAGNTVDICPVGALTSKDFRYKKRVWYLNKTDSVCPGCSRGCNISVHYEDDKVYRLKPRENQDVNQFWMCDIGRHDYQFINTGRRLNPTVFENNAEKRIPMAQALDIALKEILKHNPHEIAFIASAQESNEEIDALVDFAKEFGVDHIYYSKNDPQNKYSDDILINEDKNPNMAHINKLGLKPVSELSSDIKAVVVQRNLNDADRKIVEDKNLPVLIVFATNNTELDTKAHVILPIPTYAEQNGSFTNFENKVQSFQKAFDPRGESALIEWYLGEFKKQLNRKEAS